MEKRPKVGVGVFLIKNKKVLLLKRKVAHGEGSWCPPGGHLEFKETIEDCAIRKVMEETGIKIENPKFITITNDIFEKENKHYITIFMSAQIDKQEPKNMEPEKCDALEWFSWNNLPENLFIPVKNLISQGNSPFKI